MSQSRVEYNRWRQILEKVLPVVCDAGNLALSYSLRPGLKIETKSDGSPVTLADRDTESWLRDRLPKVAPGIGVIGEEFGEGDAGPDENWVIDPIDGTRAFTRGLPFWATLVALMSGGRPRIGIVHAPALGIVAWATEGGGAWVDGCPARVSTVSRLEDAFISIGSMDIVPEQTWAPRALELMGRAWTTRGFGDATAYLDLIVGSIDAMVDPLVNLWDIAPIQILIEEAGGTFTGLDGQPEPRGGSGVLGSNGHIHDEMLRYFT